MVQQATIADRAPAAALKGIAMPRPYSFLPVLGWFCLTLVPMAPAGSLDESAPAAQLTAADQQAISSAGSEVKAALSRLTSWLQPQGENGRRWQRFLKVEQLKQQLDLPAPDLDALRAIDAQFQAKHKGLEMRQFADVARSLQQYIATIELARGGIPLAIERARGGFRPLDQAELTRDTQQVGSSLAALNARFRSIGKNGAAWSEYLMLKELEAQLQQPEPDLATLQKIYDRFRSGHAGLEFRHVHAVAGDLQRLIDTANAHASDVTAEEYEAQLDKLAALPLDDAPDADQARQLSEIVEWLHRHRQAPELVGALRRRFSHNNLLLEVSEAFVASGIERPIDRTSPVRDVILGSQISGTGRTIGRLTVDFLENRRAAVIEAVLTGTNYSRTTAASGPARVYSRGTTLLRGRKRLTLTPEGIQAESAVATADLTNTITGVGATKGGLIGKIIRRAASKKAYERKSLAERISAQHAEVRLVRQLEDQARDPLGRASRGFLERFRYPLMRRGRFPQSLRFSTTNDRLLVRALEEARTRLAATLAPPELQGQHDLSLRVHESLLNNVTLEVLGGQKVTNYAMEDLVVETLGYLPDRFKDDDGDEWSITFNAEEPVTVRIEGSQVHLIVRGDAFTSGDKEYTGMNISTSYTLELTGAGLRGTRPEKLEILPPDFDPASGQRLPLRLTVLRNLLQRRFGEMLPQEFEVDEIELEEPWNTRGNLVISDMRADQGWLMLAADPAADKTAAQPQAGAAMAANAP